MALKLIQHFSFISCKQAQLQKIRGPADNVLFIPAAALWRFFLYDIPFTSVCVLTLCCGVLPLKLCPC